MRVAVPTLLAGLLLIACDAAPPRAPEDELRTALDEIVAALEDHDPEAVLRFFAFDFREEGGLDYGDLQSIVLTHLLRSEPIGARLESVVIRPETPPGTGYRAELQLILARGSRLRDPGLPLPTGAVRYAIELRFERGESGWQAHAGRYRRL
ncbi:MAG: hypothetical protein ACE5FG_13890 [Myxococcota bacterium]